MEKKMSDQINYKQKYQELKLKFMESVDTAFRLGYEQGAQQATQDAAAMQQQQAQEMQMQQQGGGPDFSGGGAEGSQPGAEQMANPNGGETPMEPDSQNPAGSELDQHIEKLESMIAKAEDLTPANLANIVNDMRKAKQQRETYVQMRKSTQAIPAIAKALHKPAFKLNQNANHNMNNSAKAAVGMQEKIVTDIMKAWADEESKASKDIKQTLNIEGLLGKKS